MLLHLVTLPALPNLLEIRQFLWNPLPPRRFRKKYRDRVLDPPATPDPLCNPGDRVGPCVGLLLLAEGLCCRLLPPTDGSPPCQCSVRREPRLPTTTIDRRRRNFKPNAIDFFRWQTAVRAPIHQGSIGLRSFAEIPQTSAMDKCDVKLGITRQDHSFPQQHFPRHR